MTSKNRRTKEPAKSSQERAKDDKPKGTNSKSNKVEAGSADTHKPHHRHHSLSEVEDQFEEFEPRNLAQTSEPDSEQRDVADRVTVWMNSWMDEDDGDFAQKLEDEQRIKQ